MAQVAIPIAILGGMWILSNQGTDEEAPQNEEDQEGAKKEGYENISAEFQRILHPGSLTTGEPVKPNSRWGPVSAQQHTGGTGLNYPVQDYNERYLNPVAYPSPNAAVDRYYRQSSHGALAQAGGKPAPGMLFKSLSGNEMQRSDIKFNNMIPFFGSKITGASIDRAHASLLDNMAGAGSQKIRKVAQGPLFKPQDNMTWPHGTPVHTDFIQSRMNPSRNVSNVKPWQEIRVGPGLDQGYTWKGAGGFNAGTDARSKWLPPTVDQLRVKTNPKVTFGLGNHEGPANSRIKRPGIEGRVEKNRPDTFYVSGPDRWLTTTGREKAQTARPTIAMQPVNRPFTTREYFGDATGNQGGVSAGAPREPKFRQPHKVQLKGYGEYLGPAHNLNYETGWKTLNQAYGKDGYKVYPNARTTTRQPVEFGIVGRGLWAAVAPVLDLLRPSRKEDVIGNARPTGNVQGHYGVEAPRIWNPADRAPITIRQQTEDNKYEPGPFLAHEGGYATAQYNLRQQQRETTQCPYTGDASPGNGAELGPVYNAAYNAHLNPNKERISRARMNAGSEALFNSAQNIKSSKIGSGRPAEGPLDMPKTSGSVATYGQMGGRNTRGARIETSRIQPAILDSFRSNPYTQSLQSVA